MMTLPPLIKFALVGALAAAVHLSALHALVSWLGFTPLTGNAVAFAIAFSISYAGQSQWTFNHKSHQHSRAVVKFLLIQLLCSFGLNQGLYALLLSLTTLHYLLASTIVLVTVPLVTFTLSKYWAFN